MKARRAVFGAIFGKNFLLNKLQKMYLLMNAIDVVNFKSV